MRPDPKPPLLLTLIGPSPALFAAFLLLVGLLLASVIAIMDSSAGSDPPSAGALAAYAVLVLATAITSTLLVYALHRRTRSLILRGVQIYAGILVIGVVTGFGLLSGIAGTSMAVTESALAGQAVRSTTLSQLLPSLWIAHLCIVPWIGCVLVAWRIMSRRGSVES